MEDLVSRARYYAQTNRAYSLEIIVHLQDHACQFSDSALFGVCRELMSMALSPSPYPLSRQQQHAGDENNRPKNEALPVTNLPYDNSLDQIFDERVKAQAVKTALERLTFKKSGRVYWYVVYKVLLHLKWLKEDCEQKAFLEWVNLQFRCQWTKKQHFTFSRDVDKSMRNVDVTLWSTLDYNQYTKGEVYSNFAILLRNTFEIVVVNNMALKEPAKDFTSGKNRDRSEFMRNPNQLINWGK